MIPPGCGMSRVPLKKDVSLHVEQRKCWVFDEIVYIFPKVGRTSMSNKSHRWKPFSTKASSSNETPVSPTLDAPPFKNVSDSSLEDTLASDPSVSDFPFSSTVEASSLSTSVEGKTLSEPMSSGRRRTANELRLDPTPQTIPALSGNRLLGLPASGRSNGLEPYCGRLDGRIFGARVGRNEP